MTFVSVVIPSYNSKKTIKQCLQSIAESTYKNIEIIVVDDCSNDNSPELVESLKLNYSLKLIRQKQNSGPAAARNAGANAAMGDLIFFLDSDTAAFPDTIENTVIEMKRLKADAITGIYHWDALNFGYIPEYKAFFNFTFFSRKGTIPYEVFDSSRACIKKEVFLNLGGFNEELKWGMDYENEEFGYRLVKKYKNYLVPKIFVRHHFPGFKKLTRTYFQRVAYWAEIFASRKQFESGGITSSDMGFGTVSILPTVILLPFLADNYLFWLPIFFFLFYLKTFANFFMLCFKKKGYYVGTIMVLLNIYFSLMISLGAVYGFCRHFHRRKEGQLALNKLKQNENV